MRIIAIVICCLGLTSCSFLDSSDDIPMYLDIDSVVLTDSQTDPQISSNITSVSVYADGFSIGIYPWPSEIPVLDLNEDGTVEIDIFAAVKNNGQGSDQLEYPFYQPLNFTFDYVEDKHYALDLEFEYKDNIQLLYNDTFEQDIPFNQSGQSNATDFVLSSDTPYGQFCGLIETSDSIPIFEEESEFKRDKFAIENSVVFLELDYKNTIPFQVGYLGYAGPLGIRKYKLVLTPTSEWNKVYIELTAELNFEDFDTFAILLGSSSANDIGKVWIDNVRLIRFEP